MEWVRLSQRSGAELRAQAAEYRRMAQSARTLHTASGLLRLSERFDALAEQLQCEEHGRRGNGQSDASS
jgi:hypothetical protein